MCVNATLQPSLVNLERIVERNHHPEKSSPIVVERRSDPSVWPRNERGEARS